MSKIHTEKKKLTSFDKSFSSKINFIRPDKYSDLESINKFNGKINTSGSNLSYPALSFYKDDLNINFDKFNKIINFNKYKKEITVQGGMKLYELLNFLLKHNFWIPQLPGYPLISVGGAVAANVHGKSSGYYGTIRKSVKEILLFHKINGWINLSEKKNKEVFSLTLGGLGLTGTIVNVTFKLEKFNFTEFQTLKQKTLSIYELIKYFKNMKHKKNEFIYSWNITNSNHSFGKGFIFKNIPIKTDKKIKDIELKKKIKLNLPFSLWNKFSTKIFNNTYFKYLSLKNDNFNESFVNAMFPFHKKEQYFTLFGRCGFIESQLLVPKNVIDNFFEEFIYLFHKYQPCITLFSIKVLSGEQKLIRFEGNGICVTFDFVNNKKSLFFLKKLDKLCIKYKILPSIIKDSRLNSDTFRKCYDQSIIFKDMLNKFDKKRIYQSELSKRLKI